ncbi:DUF3261 domain-containing protein [Tatumella sp. UBA2305]|uniref:DUF3261 domain-containing protein n=1 Tax=Tatumella sp. UBA2305 TaxID=1947647 RepID=UPI0025F94268|nr:DUF3261 domain-containing protein [Tatumella sp. UBA2305]
MKRCLLLSLFTIFSLTIAGCQTRSHPQENRPEAWLKAGTKVELPPPGITPPFSSQQMLTGHFQGKSQSLLVLLNADQHKLTLAGLSPVGIRLFLLTYDRLGIHSEQSLVVPHLPPASQVLADVMLSFYPVSVWQKQLPEKWTLLDEGMVRRLIDPDNQTITKIDYMLIHGKRVPISITQQAFHYQITMQYLND